MSYYIIRTLYIFALENNNNAMSKEKRTALIKVGDTTFDKIKAFYINPEQFPLSEKLEEIRLRWLAVTNFSLKSYGKVEIANMLMKDYGISQAQAYIDIRNADNIFGSITETNHEAFKAMWIEWTKDYLKRCRQTKDLKSEGKALDLLAKYGISSAENLEFNPEKLENKELKILVPKEQLDILKQMVSKGVVDFNKLNVIDVPFENIANE